MTFRENWGKICVIGVCSSTPNRLQSLWPQSFITSTSRSLPHNLLGLLACSCSWEKGASRSPSHNRQEQHRCFIPGLHYRARRAATAVAPPPPRPTLYTPRPQPRPSPHRPRVALPPRQSSPEHLGWVWGVPGLLGLPACRKLKLIGSFLLRNESFKKCLLSLTFIHSFFLSSPRK